MATNDKYYYCPDCDLEIQGNELIDNKCPYCELEIPDAVEDDSKEASQ